LVELRSVLVDTGTVVGRVTAESDVEVLQEGVAASEKRLGLVGMSINTRLSIKDNDSVSEIGGHDEIVLDDESSLLGVHDESLDNTRGDDTLLGIEVGRGLVDEVNISRDTESKNNGNTLQFTTGQILDLLINEVIKLEGLNNVGLELGGQERLLDLLEEQLANSAIELGGNGLGLHADSHLGDALLAVGLEGAGQETTEGCLSSTVLTHHDNDLGISEVTSFDVELEVAKGLLHLGVGERTRLVDLELICGLSNSECQRLITESQVLGGNVTVKEDVDTLANGVRECDDTVNGRLAVKNTDVVGEVIENRQIVLDNDDVVVITEERADDQSGAQTLLDIEVRGRLVEHVDIGLLDGDSSNSETLELTTRKEVDVTVHNVVQLKDVGHLFHVAERGSALDEVSNTLVRASNGPWDLVHILRLDHGLEVIL
jgi:hypothetical protein